MNDDCPNIYVSSGYRTVCCEWFKKNNTCMGIWPWPVCSAIQVSIRVVVTISSDLSASPVTVLLTKTLATRKWEGVIAVCISASVAPLGGKSCLFLYLVTPSCCWVIVDLGCWKWRVFCEMWAASWPRVRGCSWTSDRFHRDELMCSAVGSSYPSYSTVFNTLIDNMRKSNV